MSRKSKKDQEQIKEQEVEMETPLEQEEVDQTAELEKKVAELEEKVAKDKDDYIRLMAEFENFRRRTSQEKL